MNESTAPLQGTGCRAYRIPAARVDYLREKLAALDKRARKLGVGPVGMQVASLEEFVGTRWNAELAEEETFVLHFAHVVVYGGRPHLPGGWQFYATIQHTDEGNILRSTPSVPAGFSFPESFRTCAASCDHCKTVRRRIDTFILRAENGDLKHVGRNCIAAYLGGQSADALGAQFELWNAIGSALEFAEGDDADCQAPGGGSANLFDLQSLLAWVNGVLRVDGGSYVSGAAAMRAEESTGVRPPTTKDNVMLAMFPPQSPSEKLRKWLREVRPTDADRARAGVILAKARELLAASTDDNDFTHNLRVVCRLEYLSDREVGLGCYVWEFVRRAEARAVEAEERAKAHAASTHVGKVGERLRGLELTVQRVIGLPDYGFGPSSINIFADATGNLFVWKTGTSDFAPGESVKLDGTVKEHSDYKGVLQTVLTRCKLK